MTVRLRGTCKERHKHSGECMTYHYDICIRRKRYRGALPECRTRKAAEQAEVKIKQEIFDRRFGTDEQVEVSFSEFFENEAMTYAETDLKSSDNWKYNKPVILDHFRGKTLNEIQPLDIKRLKEKLFKTETKHGKTRSPATVNRVLEIVSRTFTLAIELQKAEINPCSRVKFFKLDNERIRWVLPEEEEELLKNCTGRLSHLNPMVVISLATGLRKQELLQLQRSQVDLFRDLIIATHTKGSQNREIPTTIFGPETASLMRSLCSGKKADDFIFVNKSTKKPYTDVKHAFRTLCVNSKVEGLVWHDLRATFATRLAEMNYSPFLIKDLMGHSEIETTERYIRAAALRKQVRMHETENGRHNNVTSIKKTGT
jgi:integrase